MKALTALPSQAYVQVSEEANVPLADLLRLVQELETNRSPAYLARYRPDVSAGLDAQRITEVRERLREFIDLSDRRVTILTAIGRQDRLTPELRQAIETAATRHQLEDLYLPYKPRRRTPADDAVEKGLEPLARLLWAQEPADTDLQAEAENLKGQAANGTEALAGAVEIIARWLGENGEVRRDLRKTAAAGAELVVEADSPARKAGGKAEAARKRAASLSGLRKPAADLPWRQALSIRRAERERTVRSSLVLPRERILHYLRSRLLRHQESPFNPYLEQAAVRAFEEYLEKPLANETLLEFEQRVDEEAVKAYAKSLRKLLTAPGAGAVATIGIEAGRPGGWRATVVGANGDVLEWAVIREDESKAKAESDRAESEGETQSATAAEEPEAAAASEPSGEDAGADDTQSEDQTAEKAEAQPEAAADADAAPAETQAQPAAVDASEAEAPETAEPAEQAETAPAETETPTASAETSQEADAPAPEAASETAPDAAAAETPAAGAPAAEASESAEESKTTESETAPEPAAPAEAPAAEAKVTADPEAAKLEAADEATSETAAEQPAAEKPQRKESKRREKKPAPPAPRAELAELIDRHGVELIAIGAGPNARQVERFVRSEARKAKGKVAWTTVNEAGTWIYATSKAARKELPKLDPPARSAASLARRLQDPLAELIKIDPRIAGIGSGLHEADQKRLRTALDAQIEAVVHEVGVDVNRAPAELLARVAGFTERAARRLVEHREKNGPFASREAVEATPGLAGRVYEQAAGFLRVPGGAHPLDATGVHPRHYAKLEAMAEAAGVSLADAVGNPAPLAALDLTPFIDKEHPEAVLRGMLRELEPRRLNPRGEFKPPDSAAADVEPLAELKVGVKAKGLVTNVTAFGVFLDIGASGDGLLHVSQLTDELAEAGQAKVKPGDRLDVWVTHVNPEADRISLSMREPRESSRRRRVSPEARGEGGRRGDRPRRGGPRRDDNRAPVRRTFGPDREQQAREEERVKNMSMGEKLNALQDRFRTKVDRG